MRFQCFCQLKNTINLADKTLVQNSQASYYITYTIYRKNLLRKKNEFFSIFLKDMVDSSKYYFSKIRMFFCLLIALVGLPHIHCLFKNVNLNDVQSLMCVQCILTLVDENTSSPIAYKLLVVKSNTRINMRTTSTKRKTQYLWPIVNTCSL